MHYNSYDLMINPLTITVNSFWKRTIYIPVYTYQISQSLETEYKT